MICSPPLFIKHRSSPFCGRGKRLYPHPISSYVQPDSSHHIYEPIGLFCLFGVFRPIQEFFTHVETSPLPGKDRNFFTCAWHSRPLSSEVSLACHTNCDTAHLFIRGPVTSTPVVELIAVELPLPVKWRRTVAVWIRTLNNPNARRKL